MTPTSVAEPARWSPLYRTGAIGAVVMAVLLVGEVAVYASGPRPASALEHFQLFQRDPVVGLLTLDLLGLIAYLVFLPTLLGVCIALRTSATALVAALLFVLGVADFLATNTAFPVLDLSNRYAAAATDADRAAILAAGEAMFTLFDENAFLVSYVVVSASWVLLGVAMARSAAFRGPTAWAGILAGGAGIVAVVLEHVSAALVDAAIPVYFAAIVFLFAWVLLVSRALGRLASVQVVRPGPSERVGSGP